MSVINCKVKFLRQNGYDNLKEWVSNPENIYIGRAGVVFVKSSSENGKSEKKERFPKKSSIFANPFKVGKDGTRDEVLELYETWIRGKLGMERDEKCKGRRINSSNAKNPSEGSFRKKSKREKSKGSDNNISEIVSMRSSLMELKGCTLGCWCHPEACHGDVLLKLIGELSEKEKETEKGPKIDSNQKSHLGNHTSSKEKDTCKQTVPNKNDVEVPRSKDSGKKRKKLQQILNQRKKR